MSQYVSCLCSHILRFNALLISALIFSYSANVASAFTPDMIRSTETDRGGIENSTTHDPSPDPAPPLEAGQPTESTRYTLPAMNSTTSLANEVEKSSPSGKWWQTLHHFGPYDHLNDPGNILLTPENNVVFTDTMDMFVFGIPTIDQQVKPERIRMLNSIPGASRSKRYIGQTKQDVVYFNFGKGIYRVNGLSAKSSHSLKLIGHPPQSYDPFINGYDAYKSDSDSLVIDDHRGVTWCYADRKLQAFSHEDNKASEFPLFQDQWITGLTAISGYDNHVYTVAPLFAGGGLRYALAVSDTAFDAKGEGTVVWSQSTNVDVPIVPELWKGVPFEAEIALSDQKLFIVFGYNIFVFDRVTGDLLFHETVLSENKPLKGLVVDGSGRLFTQGQQGIYSVSNSGLRLDFAFAEWNEPAGGLVLAEGGHLISTRLTRNRVPFKQLASGKPRLHVQIFTIEDDGLTPVSPGESFDLESRYYGRSFPPPPDDCLNWMADAPVLSDDGHLLMSLHSLTWEGCVSFNHGFTTGTNLILMHPVGLKLDSTAPWPKKYRDNRNSNHIATSDYLKHPVDRIETPDKQPALPFSLWSYRGMVYCFRCFIQLFHPTSFVGLLGCFE